MTLSRRLISAVMLAFTLAAVPVAIAPLAAHTQHRRPVAGLILCCAPPGQKSPATVLATPSTRVS